jgi:crotonobetainyl-CoA:carnitine CoA-transferase CaiB-like acyl-CoA transferase
MLASALDGVRVLDLSTRVAGAWCSRLLADFGADVVMVEPPGGNPVRALAPFDADGGGIVGAYVLANRRSVTLDLASEQGRAALADLAAGCDVVVDSAVPGADFDALEQRRDGAILVSVTPHGLTGARAAHEGNDLTAHALSGWASVNGLADREPLKGSGFMASYVAGTAAYGATVTALLHRELHGRGQHIDVSETEALLEIFSAAFLRGQYFGEPFPRREKIDMTGSFPVPVRDGYLSLTVGRGDRARDAMIALGLHELADNEKLMAGPFRLANDPEIAAQIEAKALEWDRMELFEALSVLRVIAGPVLSVGELSTNEQLVDRGYFVRPPDAPDGPRYPGAPVKLGATPWSMRRSQPAPGEHTAEVLRELAGYDDARVDAVTAAEPPSNGMAAS